MVGKKTNYDLAYNPRCQIERTISTGGEILPCSRKESQSVTYAQRLKETLHVSVVCIGLKARDRTEDQRWVYLKGRTGGRWPRSCGRWCWGRGRSWRWRWGAYRPRLPPRSAIPEPITERRRRNGEGGPNLESARERAMAVEERRGAGGNQPWRRGPLRLWRGGGRRGGSRGWAPAAGRASWSAASRPASCGVVVDGAPPIGRSTSADLSSSASASPLPSPPIPLSLTHTHYTLSLSLSRVWIGGKGNGQRREVEGTARAPLALLPRPCKFSFGFWRWKRDLGRTLSRLIGGPVTLCAWVGRVS
jgi:hypothetical protein